MANSSGGWSPSNIKPGGWFILLLILCAVYWFGIKPRLGSGTGPTSPVSAPQVGSSPSGIGKQTTPGNLPQQAAKSGDILVSTSGTKQQWLAQEVDKFNKTSQGHATLADPVESREAMQGIFNGKLQPTVWSPSSPVWTERLGQLKSGMVDESDPSGYRVVFKSPLVFLTTKAKAAQLRPILTSATPFTQLAKLAAQHRVKFGYADPIAASSGMLTMSLIITEYSRTHGGNDLTALASSAGFASFLRQLNQGLVKTSDNAGSSKLEKAYESDPSSRDFITAYENSALSAAAKDPNFVLIYPSPTANADQGIAILNAPWVSSAQQQTAQAFLRFVAKPESQADGAVLGFRPAVNGAGALSEHLTPEQKASFQPSYTSVELPPYDALNEAAAVYHASSR